MALCLVLSILFLADTALVVAVGLPGIDRSLALGIQAFEWGPVSAVMVATNWLADVRQAIFAVLVVGLLAIFSRRAALIVMLGIPASVAAQVLKLVVARPRPPANLLHVAQPESSFGFPSGHATFYAWLVPLVIVAVNPWVPRRLRAPTYLLGGALIAFGATARVWAGVHWPTDVLGGLLLGGAWAALIIYLTDRRLAAAGPIEPDTTTIHTA